jgi:hypothetical protein
MDPSTVSEPAAIDTPDGPFTAVSDESLEEAAATRFGAETSEEPGEEPQEPAETPEPDGESADSAEPQTSPEAPQAREPYHFADLGVTIDEELARTYALFEHRLRTDPQFLAAVQGVLGVPGAATPPSPVQPPAEPAPTSPAGPPPELDLDDPATRWFVNQVETLRDQVEAARTIAAAHESYITGVRNETNRGIVESAVRAFQEQKGLSDTDIAEIRQIAGTRVQLGPDAATDPAGAVHSALEIAYWSIPRFRDQLLAQNQTQAAEDRKRQRKLAAVTGSSGAAPRTAPEPQTNAERKAAFADAIRNAWAGNDVS